MVPELQGRRILCRGDTGRPAAERIEPTIDDRLPGGVQMLSKLREAMGQLTTNKNERE